MSANFNPAFKKWFKNSVVVNEDGSPMVVYHGTDDYRGSGGFEKFWMPAYFAEDPKYAELFMHERVQAFMFPVYLSIQRPLDLTSLGVKPLQVYSFIDFLAAAGIAEELNSDDFGFGELVPPWGYIRQATLKPGGYAMNAIRKAGFDGIVQWENNGRKKSIVWVAFKQSQIKSAIGNDGSWDMDDDDIRSNPRKRR